VAKFQSRCPNQVLCIKPARNAIIDGVVVPVPGEHIRFERGICVLDDKEDKDKIAFLRKHRLFGTAIVEIKEKDTQKPTQQQTQDTQPQAPQKPPQQSMQPPQETQPA